MTAKAESADHSIRSGHASRSDRGIGTALDPMAVFAPVRSLDVRSLAGPALEVQVPTGSRLVNEECVVGTFFVIRSGEAECWRAGQKLRTLATGDCFGEIDPMAARPQHYTVVAASPMRLLTFSAFGIGRLCTAMPNIRGRILSFLPNETGRYQEG